MGKTTREHLPACAACNKQHRQFEEDSEPERNEAREDGWGKGREERSKRAPQAQTAKSPTGDRTKRPEKTPEKTPARPPGQVYQCVRSKKPQHPTCFQCSGHGNR